MAKRPLPKDALASALRILALREHTTYELAQKLRLKDFNDEEIETALEQCRAWNYLDDKRAARVLAKSLQRKGAGQNKIAFELKKRKVPQAEITKVFAELNINENQLETALKLVAKKFVRVETPAEIHKQKGKIYRFLQSKGYPADIIYQVFAQYYTN